jgi:hypothetical protein
MSMTKHVIQVLDPEVGTDFLDRTILAQKVNLAYGTGTNPTVAVTFAEGLPQSYGVFANASGNFPVAVSNKTSSGFTLTIVGTVGAAGTVDVLVVAA